MAGNMVFSSLALLVLSRLALGAVTPTAPGPGEVFTAGSECSIAWTADQSGKWKSFSIDLMSGSNSNMTLVTNVAEDLDGTDPSLSPYTWTCPEVDPYSTIYFYQFNTAADRSNPAWTTRFTIESSAGETTAPPHSKQPNGDEIPWGFGVAQSGSPMASREKHSGKASAKEPDDSDEEYSSGDDDKTSQRSSSGEVEETEDEDDSVDIPTTGTSSRKGGITKGGTSSEDSDDLESPGDDETTTSTKSKSSKSSLKDAEEPAKPLNDSTDSDATDLKNGGTDVSPASEEDEESEPENTSSRMKTVHSKPTSTPFSPKNIAVATPTLSLPSATPLSAQPVGCAGGINATSSYCSTNHARYVPKLDLSSFLAAVFLCLFTLL